MNVDRLLRRLIPSTSRLTFNPIFKIIVDSLDSPLRILLPEFREFRNLPPNHMRIRVGVGNRLILNYETFIRTVDFWIHAFADNWIDLGSTIVDIGCGCGRYAYHLRDFSSHGRRFSGRYIGIDIDREMIEWCRKNFDAERFSFEISTHGSASYNRATTSNEMYRLPVATGSVDLVFSTSLFTHLLEREAQEYIAESARVLRPGGVMAHTFFCMDHLPPTYGIRHTFSNRMGAAYVESLAQPQAAVAYGEDVIFDWTRQAGFIDPQLMVAPREWQILLIARRSSSA